MTCVVGMACIVLRHAERADYVDAAWVAAAREAVVMVAEAKEVVRYEGEASEQTVFTE